MDDAFAWATSLIAANRTSGYEMYFSGTSVSGPSGSAYEITYPTDRRNGMTDGQVIFVSFGQDDTDERMKIVKDACAAAGGNARMAKCNGRIGIVVRTVGEYDKFRQHKEFAPGDANWASEESIHYCEVG